MLNKLTLLKESKKPLLCRKDETGFTLIEISIVLVIIALIVGGVLVGQELISGAQIRAQISQIEQYQTAVKTFQVKYGYLAGDIPDPQASQFGLVARIPANGVSPAGIGNGNGILENASFSGNASGISGLWGELMLFWRDLADSKLIEGKFYADKNDFPSIIYERRSQANDTSQAIQDYFPHAKVGYGYIVVNSGGIQFDQNLNAIAGNGKNYFSTFSMSYWGNYNGFYNNSTVLGDSIFTPAQAYAIDKKIDDGLPQSGKITAMMGGAWSGWASNSISCDPVNCGAVVAGDGVQTTATQYTCYDNNNIAGATEKYSTNSIAVNNINCGLSWEFQ